MITILLMILAGLFSACMDVLRFRWQTCVFRRCKNQGWVDPSLSYKNKWKNGDQSQGEKFFGSSTFLVFLTDLWHFCKLMMLVAVMLGTALYAPVVNWYVDFMILYLSFTISFEIFYSRILSDPQTNL